MTLLSHRANTPPAPIAVRPGAGLVFDTRFGIAWFARSAAMGFPHVRSILALVVLSVVLQLAASPFLFIAVGREGEAA